MLLGACVFISTRMYVPNCSMTGICFSQHFNTSWWDKSPGRLLLLLLLSVAVTPSQVSLRGCMHVRVLSLIFLWVTNVCIPRIPYTCCLPALTSDFTQRLFSCRDAFGGTSFYLCGLCGHLRPRQWADENTSHGLVGMGTISLWHWLWTRAQELHQASHHNTFTLTHGEAVIWKKTCLI